MEEHVDVVAEELTRNLRKWVELDDEARRIGERVKAIREEKKQTRITHDRTIISCDCGGSYQNYQKKRHMESKKHQHFMEIQ
jgi:hypothetical protein